MKVHCDFGVLVLFLIYEIILVVCDFRRTIRACGCLLLLFMRFGCLYLAVGY
jgi:hypothetical protein